MQRPCTSSLLGGIVLLLVQAMAQAQSADPAVQRPDNERLGWLASASAMYARYDVDNSSYNDDNLGLKLAGQYRFNRHFGIELAGLATGNFRNDTAPENEGGDAKYSVKGLSLDGVGYLPWSPDDVALYGKVGVYTFDQELQIFGSSSTQSANGLTLGVGGAVSITDRYSLRVEGDWYSLDNASMWTASLGLNYHFGGP